MAIERIVPGTVEWEAYYANHISRYMFAQRILDQGKATNILDAACGVGYGTHFLATHTAAAKITGVDRSAEALAVAGTQFNHANIAFITDDCHTLQAASAYGPFDTIVSFETLEHLPKPEDFLNSCYRELKNGGTIIVSTPNKTVSSPEQLNWEFHEKEYTAGEFYQLMTAAGFTNIQLYGQQFSMKGKIKNEIRSDLNRLFSNPFVRAGRWVQAALRGHKPVPVLPESLDDFEIRSFQDTLACEAEGTNGPFVLIVTAQK